MSIAAALLVTTVIGGTLAAFQAEGDVRNQVTTGKLGIQLLADGQAAGSGQLYVSEALPGADIEKTASVKNSESYDLYTRVKITKYWGKADQAADGQVTGFTKDTTKDASKITLKLDEENWLVPDIEVGDSSEEVILYYKKPLAAGETTTDFLKGLQIDTALGNAYTDTDIMLEIETDAVQKIAAQDAILTEWGLAAEFDDAGNLISVAE